MIAEALGDTSTFIAVEQDRPMGNRPPGRLFVSSVTIAELRLGVLTASTPTERSLRLRTLHRAQQIEPLPVDRPVAFVLAELRRAPKDAERKLDENDA